jgi:hypothetical protein
MANTLSAQGDFLTAIPYYEQAILEEPDFSLPYQRLLGILKEQRHPHFEFWIDKAVRLLPTSPIIADFYAMYLWDENRLEELANADWMDEVEVETDYSIIGRPDYSPEATKPLPEWELHGFVLEVCGFHFGLGLGLELCVSRPKLS